jgi:hypothetical protein
MYRTEGDLARVSRCSYLSDNRDRTKLAAVERAYGSDDVRTMKVLHWHSAEDDTTPMPGPPSRPPSSTEERPGAPIEWDNPAPVGAAGP